MYNNKGFLVPKNVPLNKVFTLRRGSLALPRVPCGKSGPGAEVSSVFELNGKQQ